MEVASATWPELGERLRDEHLALVPVGSTEGHGPHLPTGTDHVIAAGLAEAAAERGEFLVTPGIDVGVSPHHRQFPGTLWVDPPAFRDYVESYTRNLTYHGVDRVVYVNAHGGNVQHLREVGRRLREDDAAFAVEWMWDESIPDLVDELFEHNGPHAGPKETALVQYLAGDTVREDRLADARDGGVQDIRDAILRKHGARVFYDSVENSPNGAFGDQTDATPEKGERLFEAAVEQLVQLAAWLDDQAWTDLRAPARVEPPADT